MFQIADIHDLGVASDALLARARQVFGSDVLDASIARCGRNDDEGRWSGMVCILGCRSIHTRGQTPNEVYEKTMRAIGEHDVAVLAGVLGIDPIFASATV